MVSFLKSVRTICMRNIGSFILCLEIKCLTILMVPLFLFFSLIENFKMGDMVENGSDGFRVQFLHDKRGKLIRTDKLFHNLHDFWAIQHA